MTPGVTWKTSFVVCSCAEIPRVIVTSNGALDSSVACINELPAVFLCVKFHKFFQSSDLGCCPVLKTG